MKNSWSHCTVQKMKFSIKDVFSKCDQIRSFLTKFRLLQIYWLQLSKWKNCYSPPNICLFKFNNRNITKRCEICSKLTIKTPKQRHWLLFGVFFNFEHISNLFLVFLMLTFNKQMLAGFWFVLSKIKTVTPLKKNEIIQVAESSTLCKFLKRSEYFNE